MSLSKSPVYFFGLNGFRAIAALTVVIGHSIQYSRLFGLKDFTDSVLHFAVVSSGLAVTAFFVLSGFLITFLLVKEKGEKKKINIKHFYFRRILRIWPLYYIILIIALIILPVFGLINYNDFPVITALYSTLFANVALAFNYSSPIIAPLWSIAVEEQFYIFWPHIMKKKSPLTTMLTVGGGYIFIKIVLRLVNKIYPDFPESFLLLVDLTRFDCMVIGGLAALFYIRGNFTKLQVTFVMLLGLIGTIASLKYFYLLQHEFFSVCFASIIIMTVKNNNRTWLDSSLLNSIGKISFGIYMYHMLIISYVTGPMMSFFNYTGNLALPIISTILVTLLVSYVSFTFIEVKLLRLKTKLESF